VSDNSSKVTDAYRRLFASEDGAVVFQDLCQRTGFLNSGIGSDSQDTAYRAGLRDAFAYILDRVQPEGRLLANPSTSDSYDPLGF